MAILIHRVHYSNNHSNHNMENSEPEPNDSDDGASVSSFQSDASSDVTQLDPTDFAEYFCERDGRLFHSDGSSPYPLPVDAREQEVSDPLLTLLNDD